MANEYRVSLSLVGDKGGAGTNVSVAAAAADMTGNNFMDRTQDLTTSAEALDIGDCATLKFVAIKNVGSTNVYVALDNALTYKCSTLEPGFGTLLMNPPTGIWVAAASGTGRVATGMGEA